jgi:hypothetical protein
MKGSRHLSILLILWIVTMFLWLIASLPAPSNPLAPYAGLLPWFAVLFLGLHVFFGARF